jgi:anti-sigma factor RsiW
MTMRCTDIREDLTAFRDGELEVTDARRVQQHVSECPACTTELREIEKTTDLLRQSLAELPVLRPGLETRLRAHLAEAERRPARSWWNRLWRPAIVAGLATAGVLVMASSVGGPAAVLVPLGIQAPPKKVVEKPVLYKDYEIIEHLEELENFETVIQTPLENHINGEHTGAG